MADHFKLSGKNLLHQQTPRSPLKIRNMEMLVDLQDDIPRIPTAKKYVPQDSKHFEPPAQRHGGGSGRKPQQTIRHPITSELALLDPNSLTYHHRLRDSTSFENRHKEILVRQPTAFHRQRGQCVEQLTQFCYQDRAFAWKSSDGRQSVSPSNSSRFLIESLSYDPIDLDITIARTVDFSQSRSLKSRHSAARLRREGGVSPINNCLPNCLDEDLKSCVSTTTTRSALGYSRDARRRQEEEAGTRAQIAQFEARTASTTNLSSMSKRDMAVLRSAAKRQRQENATGISRISADDALAWTGVKPIIETADDINRMSPAANVDTVLPAKKKNDVLIELGASLSYLKPLPIISINCVEICDILCNVHLFTCKRGGSVNIVLEKVAMNAESPEIARLILTKEKVSKNNIPVAPTYKSNNCHNDLSGASRYYQEKLKGWFLQNVLPRIVLFSPYGTKDFTINLLPFKVSKLKGSTFNLSVIPDTQSNAPNDVDPDIVRPNPRLVSLYFQNI